MNDQYVENFEEEKVEDDNLDNDEDPSNYHADFESIGI